MTRKWGNSWHFDEDVKALSIEDATDEFRDALCDWFTLTPEMIAAIQDGRTLHIRLGEYHGILTTAPAPDIEDRS